MTFVRRLKDEVEVGWARVLQAPSGGPGQSLDSGGWTLLQSHVDTVSALCSICSTHLLRNHV